MRLGIVVVGGVKQDARPFKPGVHDFATHGFRANGRPIIVMTDLSHDRTEAAFGVEVQGLFANGCEEEIV